MLSPLTLETAIEILSLPDRIRGYGPVKEKAVKDAKARYAQLAADLANPPSAPRQIAAESGRPTLFTTEGFGGVRSRFIIFLCPKNKGPRCGGL